ncbi:S8 family serine peptidase [Nereida sp. MMG025]|uniref:S8 family serine peptidase n=1 Tax=Nereida sp. MMG025 TaxID=2909981 RepID=UPI001EFF696B|nr:S8 family serine peptidase [Nereida sp. MMG025]MCF6445737.1 S8 family serine peptidase [Nereida sp. MMG025]
MTTPTDPLYGQQWHFALLGDIETIWEEYTGDGVSVVVYDDGVEYTHVDLDDNYDASMHFAYDTDGDGIDEVFDPMPIGSNDGHGTACAGLIGAEQGNGSGGVGVAWDVTITGVNFLEDIQFGIAGASQAESLAFITAALEHAQNFDIMSNSWGVFPGYAGPNLNSNLSTFAFATVAEDGRNGLGTIVVQASGNETANLNGSSLNVSRHVISVAATEANGFNADYSNFGVGMLIAAPASAVTTDLEGSDGYSSGDYTTGFNGTSAATPTVAGVVALMLEAEEGLGWRDVQNILAITASQTGSGLGSGPLVDEVGEWETTQSDGGSSWNGGGLSYHVNYGFGMLDAFAAVRMAEVWLTMFDEAETSANEQIVSFDYDGPAIIIPASSTFEQTVAFNVTQNIQIETIYLTVELDHTWSQDLSFGLIAPDGTVVPVFVNETGVLGFDALGNPIPDYDIFEGGLTWTFKITALLGFDSAGEWSFFVEDNFGLDGGQITDFEVEFFGSEISRDDVHIISRDFLAFTAFDATRSVLTDTNGGNDWLNFVGINSDGVGNGDLNITMTAGSTFSVDGTVWGSLTTVGDVFENLVSGDGDDVIVGNRQNNQILGMRGDDTIDGGAGADTLDGGQGNDDLTGGSSQDSISGGEGNDTITGDGSVDMIDGGDGDDDISGNFGFDSILGGDGVDDISGGEGVDQIDGGDGNDIIFGNSGSDVISGGSDNDSIFGGRGGDSVDGGSGDDYIVGGQSSDVIYGGSGDDSLLGGVGRDEIHGGNDDDTINGQDASDTLYGDGGNDLMIGGSGGDILSGGTGNDTLIGGVGTDTLNGNSGTDTLTGGSQADTFVFDYNPIPSDVIITDFEIGLDTLQLDDSLWTGTVTEQQVIDTFAVQVGSDVVFTFSFGDTATLQNVDLNNLLATDIVLYDSGSLFV